MADVRPARVARVSRSFSTFYDEGDLGSGTPHRGVRGERCTRLTFPASLIALIAGLLLTTSSAQAQGSAAPSHQHAHVHGVAKLGVAWQDKTVTLTLESPLESLIGFEHRPGNPAQKASVTALQARMLKAQDLFWFDAAAGCTLAHATAESAIFQPAASSAAEEHADLDAEFEFSCEHPDRLTTLDVGLFQVYPKLQRLDVDVATARGQFKRDLRSPQRTVSLVR